MSTREKVLELHRQGLSQKAIAEALGCHKKNVWRHLQAAKRSEQLDPAVSDHLRSYGFTNFAGIGDGSWAIMRDENGCGYSVRLKFDDGTTVSIDDQIESAIDRLRDRTPLTFEPRPEPTADNLLVVDLADVHVGKLCVKSETGYEYSREIAVHRMREGTRALLERAKPHGIGHILVVIGNDKLHVDNPQGKTTSGTPQDTHGSLDQMFDDAVEADVAVIEMCREVAPVDIMHVPSNHDWQQSYALAKTVGAWFRNDDRVRATPYNVSKRHRKYYRYGQNLLGLTHGDGAKEPDLPALMMKEARAHMGECEHCYWYTHHVHHKVRKRLGIDQQPLEKDLTGMTIINHCAATEPDDVEIEYVRSPSPPDGWHDRNGYVNRQAVECFVHSPHAGQFARFTEWF